MAARAAASANHDVNMPPSDDAKSSNLQLLKHIGRVFFLSGLAAWTIQWLVVPVTLTDKYGFAPMSTLAFRIFVLTKFVIGSWISVVVAVTWHMTPAARGGRALLMLSVVAGALLLVSNVAASVDKRYKATQEVQLALKFNAFYCNTRTLQVCIEGKDPVALRRLVKGEMVTANAICSDAPVWLHCQALVDTRIKELSGRFRIFSRSIEIVENSKRAFLNDLNITDTRDLWCGNTLWLQKNSTEPLVATDSDLQSPLVGSPYEANTWIFDQFKNEWTARTTQDNWFMGVFVVCILLQACVLIKIDQLTSFEETRGENPVVVKEETHRDGVDLDNEETARLAPLTLITAF